VALSESTPFPQEEPEASRWARVVVVVVKKTDPPLMAREGASPIIIHGGDVIVFLIASFSSK
jgi:hypothetical protein